MVFTSGPRLNILLYSCGSPMPSLAYTPGTFRWNVCLGGSCQLAPPRPKTSGSLKGLRPASGNTWIGDASGDESRSKSFLSLFLLALAGSCLCKVGISSLASPVSGRFRRSSSLSSRLCRASSLSGRLRCSSSLSSRLCRASSLSCGFWRASSLSWKFCGAWGAGVGWLMLVLRSETLALLSLPAGIQYIYVSHAGIFSTWNNEFIIKQSIKFGISLYLQRW